MLESNQQFVSVPEAATILRVTEGRVRQLLLADPPQLRGVKINQRAWVIPKSEIDRRLRERRDHN